MVRESRLYTMGPLGPEGSFGSLGGGGGGGEALTRQELAGLLYRYETEKRGGKPRSAAPLDGYADVDEIDKSALDAMRWAVERGLIRGMDDGTLAPAAPLSRVQLAAILYRCAGGGAQ